MADPRPVIARLRDGLGLDMAGAGQIAQGLADGGVSDTQAAAFAMAVLIRGLSNQERTLLTRAMRDSGRVMQWDFPGPIIDKHSTGGVGDVVSLVLAPVLAACGGYVPMISGRGLGHTGGTLDKLESIPGFSCELDETAFRAVVHEAGCAIVAASADLAPADRRLYAIRDEAACVESIDLITASILSKKLAAGLDALVLDVKTGSGAFLGTPDTSRQLAQSLVQTANAAGCQSSALITDMNQPLARAAGNGLEVMEAIACLRGKQSALRDLVLALAGEALALTGQEAPLIRAAKALDSGQAAEIFGCMVSAQGGTADLMDAPARYLPAAPLIRPVPAPVDKFVAAIDTAALGHAVIGLGGGRIRAHDRIDHRVGLSGLLRLNEQTRSGLLCMVHARNEAEAERAIMTVQAAYRLTSEPPKTTPLIHDHIAYSGQDTQNTRYQSQS
ncbi:MAG: thymidine phosphorylase [Paracoccus sp. (in: a-proteobacteria)]